MIIVKRQPENGKKARNDDKEAVSVMMIPAGAGDAIEAGKAGLAAELAGAIAKMEAAASRPATSG